MNNMWKLLIADDEPNIRENLKLLFPWEQLHIQVTYLASDGQEAYHYIRQNAIDLVLADIRMPVMDGLELARILKEEKPAISVVLLSAFSDFEYARSAMRHGVCAYLTKPVRYTELVETFRRLTDAAYSPEIFPEENRMQTEEQPESYKGYYQEIISLIQRYVQSDVGSASLIGAAEYAGLSPSYVSTIFHRFLGKTFSEFLTETRMQKADLLLAEGKSIADTAWTVGYNHPKNFIRAYRQYAGADPVPRIAKKDSPS